MKRSERDEELERDDPIIREAIEFFRERTEEENATTWDVIRRIKLERDVEKLDVDDETKH